MHQYRKEIVLDVDTDYAWALLGAIPGYPGWHMQSQPSKYPFPTTAAARLFATNNAAGWPGRRVEVRTLEGGIESIQKGV